MKLLPPKWRQISQKKHRNNDVQIKFSHFKHTQKFVFFHAFDQVSCVSEA